LNFAENGSSGNLENRDQGEANGVEVLNYAPEIVIITADSHFLPEHEN
jgi:hypothetical protein